MGLAPDLALAQLRVAIVQEAHGLTEAARSALIEACEHLSSAVRLAPGVVSLPGELVQLQRMLSSLPPG